MTTPSRRLCGLPALVLAAASLAPVGPVGPVGPVSPVVPVSAVGEPAGAASVESAGAASGALGAAPAGWARWVWPLTPRPPVRHPFEAPPSAWAAGHRGLDLAGTEGAEVRAVEAGVVTHAGSVAGRPTVTVTHADGLRSTYEPVQPSVGTGDRVAAGDLLGHLAPGGHCGAEACLHLGALPGTAQGAGPGGDYLDPYPLLRGPLPVVLLPLRPAGAPG